MTLKRLLVLVALLASFAVAWRSATEISMRVVGQPRATGPIQRDLEEPFFKSLQEKTGLPVRVDYRTVDTLGFKDDHQLALMKEGLFDVVSLRFLQNSLEEPTIAGVDLPGLNPDFQSARAIGEAYGPVIDNALQQRFGGKLLGVWTFGPQVILCGKPISRLSDLRNLKVRIGSNTLAPFVKSHGGIPVVIPFEQVSQALALGLADCTISSEISAYSAGWAKHLTHVYPVAAQMGLNGIAIRLDLWNRLTENQRTVLAKEVGNHIENIWGSAEAMRSQASDCLKGNACSLGESHKLVYSPVSQEDLRFMADFALNHSFPSWAERCDQVAPRCGLQWRSIVEPILRQRLAQR